MPKYLITEEKKSNVKIQIQNQRIKMHVMKYMQMVNNIDSINADIWGQCAERIYYMIKHLD